MSTVVNMHEAKSTLSQLVEDAKAGKEVIIAKAGVPMVRLVPVVSKPRQLGIWAGKLRMSEDFDASLSDEDLAGWEGAG